MKIRFVIEPTPDSDPRTALIYAMNVCFHLDVPFVFVLQPNGRLFVVYKNESLDAVMLRWFGKKTTNHDQLCAHSMQSWTRNDDGSMHCDDCESEIVQGQDGFWFRTAERKESGE